MLENHLFSTLIEMKKKKNIEEGKSNKTDNLLGRKKIIRDDFFSQH